MTFAINDLVTNSKAPNWGAGLVINVSKESLYVFFEQAKGMRSFSLDDNPLQKVKNRVVSTALIKNLREKFYGKLSVEDRITRDEANANRAKALAETEIKNTLMTSDYQKLLAIAANPFHAMMEVETGKNYQNSDIKGRQLWYANEHSSGNHVFGSGDKRLVVLSWTHPGVQLAMTGFLGESQEIRSNRLTLTEVTPFARAKFSTTVPKICGLYEPGGRIGREEKREVSGKLKSVKLDMTKDQVHAFISKMNGMMLVTGAPGSGKTTVALQRVRFLIDQQEMRKESVENVHYEEGLTKIFLANRNLYEYSRKLLGENLSIAESVVELIKDFTTNYLNSIWVYKRKAQSRRKNLFHLELRARQAIFGLCSENDLSAIWRAYETQIAKRLKTARAKNFGPRLAPALAKQAAAGFQSNPLLSAFRLDTIYRRVRKEYEALRAALDQATRKKFDAFFQQWIYWVYDPLDTVAGYFTKIRRVSEERIRKGTALAIREKEITAEVERDWKERRYGPEEEPWLAFLLRYALPEESDQKSKFREIPSAVPGTGIGEPGRWTHVVIDEAQDLSAPEASLLGSFVHPNGAMTASADFRQVVSPVHAIRNAEPFKVGCPLKDKGIFRSYPFAVNMRQCEQIGRFLQSFHQAAFGEMARFEVSNKVQETAKPELAIGPVQELVVHIKRRMAVLRRSQTISSVALLQINEDQEGMERLRNALEQQGVDLAPAWDAFDERGRLVTTSVERIKGLEYDACFVFGMDDVERAALNFTKNRAYVALSRPARRLAILCQEFPQLLTKVDKRLFMETRLG